MLYISLDRPPRLTVLGGRCCSWIDLEQLLGWGTCWEEGEERREGCSWMDECSWMDAEG